MTTPNRQDTNFTEAKRLTREVIGQVTTFDNQYSNRHTGDVDMRSQLTSKTDNLNDKIHVQTALEKERQQDREETLKWISVSALSKFRHAWSQ
jgi:hypothetical protein